jgi:hypothetical protein
MWEEHATESWTIVGLPETRSGGLLPAPGYGVLGRRKRRDELMPVARQYCNASASEKISWYRSRGADHPRHLTGYLGARTPTRRVMDVGPAVVDSPLGPG